MKLDIRAVKQLQSGEHYTVEGCPGLRIAATQSGRTWTYRYKEPGSARMKQVKLGTWPAMPLAQAVGKWHAAKAKRDAGVDPTAEKRAVRAAAKATAESRRLSQHLVEHVCADYLSGHIRRHRKQKGADEVDRMFSTMLGDFADRPALEVTRADAFNLLEGFADVPVQAAKLRSELGAAWDYALDAGRLPANTPNWWRLVMRGRLKSKGKKIAGETIGTTKRALTEAELRTLIPWLPNFSRLVTDVLTLYLWTGARGAEIVSMHASEITEEADGHWWTVPKEKTKNARHENATDLRVPLIGRAAEVVRRRVALSPDGYLFPSTGAAGHVEQKTIQTAVHYHQPYSKTRPQMQRPRLPVTRWAPHDLRRTVRTMLASLGCPRDVAEVMIGHMLPGVEGTYNRHAYDSERRTWLERLDVKLRALAGN